MKNLYVKNSAVSNLTKPKFSLVKKLLTTILVVSMIASIGSTVFANAEVQQATQPKDEQQKTEMRIDNCPNSCGLPLSTTSWYSSYEWDANGKRFRYLYTKKVCHHCGFETPIISTQKIYG